MMRFVSHPNFLMAVRQCMKQAEPVVAPDAEKIGAGELFVMLRLRIMEFFLNGVILDV